MAYDPDLADRLRQRLAGHAPLDERRMFGGLAFLVGGHMAAAASSSGDLLVRVDPEQAESWTASPGVELQVMRGRPMRGWLHVDAEQVRTTRQLSTWVDRALSFVDTLPAKG